MRFLLYEDSDFKLEYEYNKENYIFAHCTVYKYNKNIKNRLMLVWKTLSKSLGVPYIFMATRSKKTAKFVKLFNFSYLTTKDGYDVYVYKVI